MLLLSRDDGIEILLRIFVSGIALHGTAQEHCGFLELTL